MGVSSCKASPGRDPTGVPMHAIGPPATQGLSNFYSSESREKDRNSGGCLETMDVADDHYRNRSRKLVRNTQLSDPITRLYTSDLSEMWAMIRFWPRMSATQAPGVSSVTERFGRCPNLSVIQKI